MGSPLVIPDLNEFCAGLEKGPKLEVHGEYGIDVVPLSETDADAESVVDSLFNLNDGLTSPLPNCR
jgi:hypothetical protein